MSFGDRTRRQLTSKLAEKGARISSYSTAQNQVDSYSRLDLRDARLDSRFSKNFEDRVSRLEDRVSSFDDRGSSFKFRVDKALSLKVYTYLSF